ncbi:hypothetical protein EXU30_18825 [Shewanella maritima]|uniref:Uncharacterized protein n=1 Tax=Shewanella maritima TaxID=2520507 RepID=A0A411PLV4_9GAMM|nr:hypothetical protein [Shewanella maritima]QBF84489.1 hypothetical protein EXU30_18825 [Shewanella maritima]
MNTKFNKLTAMLVATFALTACNDDDSVTPTDELPRTVTVSISSPFYKEVNLKSETPQLDGSFIKVYDKRGYPHILRTDSYRLEVNDMVDGLGEDQVIYIEDITDASGIQLDITGQAEITLVYDGSLVSELQYYYTAFGFEEVNRSINDITIIADQDPDYTYVTVDVTEDVDALNSFINSWHFGAMRNEDETVGYHFGYVRQDSEVVLTTSYGIEYQDFIDYEQQKGKHVRYSINRNEEGGIIITPPDFGKPLEPITPVEPVLSAEEVRFADIVAVNVDGSVQLTPNDASGRDESVSEKEAFAFKSVSSEEIIKFQNVQIEFDFIKDSELSSPFINIYLDTNNDGEKDETVNYQYNDADGWHFSIASEPNKKLTREEANQLVGDANLVNYWNGPTKAAVFTRFNDDNLNYGKVITVIAHEISFE